MKRFVISIIILIVIACAAAGVNHRLQRNVNSICEALQTIIESAPTAAQKELNEQAEEVLRIWKKDAAFLHMVEIHRTLEEAEQTITALPQLTKTVSREELILKCIEASQQLRNMNRSEQVLPENIF